MKKLIVIIILIIGINSFSQEKIKYVSNEKIATTISELAQESQFQKIIDLIDTVSKNDSIYTSMQINKTYYLMQLKKYEEAIKIAEIELQKPDRNQSISFYINASIAYMHLKDFENALKIADRGLKEFPKNNKLYYNKGLIFNESENYEKAIEMYIYSAKLNPFYANVHLKLGNLCYKQELTTQALMCFDTYLMLNPDGAGAFNVLNSLDKLLAIDNTNDKIESLIISEDDASFEEIDLILDNRIALDPEYKVQNEINITFVKQNHAMLQSLNTFNGNGGFWDTKYVKLYQWVQNNNHFDDFIYTTTFSIENEKFKKIVEKYKENVTAFYSTFKDKLGDIFQDNEVLGEKKIRSFYYADYALDGIGEMKDGNLVGDWKFFDENGKISSYGNFNAEGKRIGKWIWKYNDGKTKEFAFYKDGLLEGENVAYYQNGNVKYTTNYKADNLDGLYKFYNEQGALKQEKIFKAGKLDGMYKSYHNIGASSLELSANYKMSNPVGKVTKLSPSGTMIFEANYVNGERQGMEYSYYESDSLKTNLNNVNNKFEGAYKEYYPNGVLFKEGNAIGGLNSGIWKEYYPNGAIQIEYNYKDDELDGLYREFAPNGKIFYDFSYRNNELIGFKFFDQNGNVINEGRKKGGEFFYEGYSIDGNKKAEGQYNVEGGKEGEWKFYTDNGTLSAKGVYKNGNNIGEYYTYFVSGEIETIANYVDGDLNGYYRDYYENGNLYEQGYYINNIAEKEWRYYYKNGSLKSVNFHHKGELHGEQLYYSIEGKLDQINFYRYGTLLNEKHFDSNGILLNEIQYDQNTADLHIATLHPNKNIFIDINYKFGVKNGSYKQFDYLGNKLIEGNYLNGAQHGKWLWYYPNGTLKREAIYVNGNYHGIVKEYHKNGNLSNFYDYNLGKQCNESSFYGEDGRTLTGSIQILNGMKHGKRNFYDDNGNLQLIRYYEFDKLIGYSYLDKNKKEIPMIKLQNETGKIIARYDNGNKSRELEFLNGEVVNEYKTYFYNGEIASVHFNKNGNYHDKNTSYYPNGKVKEEENYSFGDRNGVTKKYYENGQLKEAVNYINDGKSGDATYYNEQGKLIKTEKYYNNIAYE